MRRRGDDMLAYQFQERGSDVELQTTEAQGREG
jgi:hypothetical protein